MELKPYQHRVIKDLEQFLEYVQKQPTPTKAFNRYWEDKLGMPYTPQLDGSFEGMKPYKDNIPGAVHIAIKVPTAGGKTFFAVNALHSISNHFNKGNTKAVVWLVPWSNLLQQTVKNLSNPNHPHSTHTQTASQPHILKPQISSDILAQLHLVLISCSNTKHNRMNISSIMDKPE